MIALKIPDTKNFMYKLLAQDVFDTFLLSEAAVTTFTTFLIDGTWHPDYYDMNGACDLPDSLTWKLVRPVIYQIVKGKNIPITFRIVLKLADYNVANLLRQSSVPISADQIDGLFLNLHYRNDEVICSTGVSLKIFTLDKTLDHVWDDMIRKFLKSKQIIFSDLA